MTKSKSTVNTAPTLDLSKATELKLKGGIHKQNKVRRVNALKNIQLKVIDIESSFYDELHALECKYALKYESLFEKRRQIVSGVYEPNDEESKWEYDDMLDKEGVTKKDEEEDNSETLDEASINKTGLPEFWLQAIKSSNLLSKMMQPNDESVLKYLSDIKIVMHEQAPIGYTIEFYFNKNEYFTNEKLTKTYSLTTEKDKKDPLSYEGPVFYKCQGCVINWNRDKNVTLKLIKKKQTNKSTGQVRVISKEEKQDSFFNFFETPTPDGIRPSFKYLMKGDEKVSSEDGEDEVDEENENLYEADFEIGNFFKELLVPKAVLYFTGLITDEDLEEEEDEDGLEEEDESEDDVNQDGDEKELSLVKSSANKKKTEHQYKFNHVHTHKH